MKVFIDTNVLVAALGTRGLCSDLMREVLENRQLVSSHGILTELRRILLKKFKLPSSETEAVIELLTAISQMAEPDATASLPIQDPDDIPHLSAAQIAQCKVFITGDKELWPLSPLGAMLVISPKDFWRMIRKQPGSNKNR